MALAALGALVVSNHATEIRVAYHTRRLRSDDESTRREAAVALWDHGAPGREVLERAAFSREVAVAGTKEAAIRQSALDVLLYYDFFWGRCSGGDALLARYLLEARGLNR